MTSPIVPPDADDRMSQYLQPAVFDTVAQASIALKSNDLVAWLQEEMDDDGNLGGQLHVHTREDFIKMLYTNAEPIPHDLIRDLREPARAAFEGQEGIAFWFITMYQDGYVSSMAVEAHPRPRNETLH